MKSNELNMVADAYFDALHYGVKLSMITFADGFLYHRTNGQWVIK